MENCILIIFELTVKYAQIIVPVMCICNVIFCQIQVRENIGMNIQFLSDYFSAHNAIYHQRQKNCHTLQNLISVSFGAHGSIFL